VSQFVFYPVDLLWSFIWHQASLHPIFNLSRPLLFVVMLRFLGSAVLKRRSIMVRAIIWLGTFAFPLFAPSMLSALTLVCALTWLGIRTVSHPRPDPEASAMIEKLLDRMKRKSEARE